MDGSWIAPQNLEPPPPLGWDPRLVLVFSARASLSRLVLSFLLLGFSSFSLLLLFLPSPHLSLSSHWSFALYKLHLKRRFCLHLSFFIVFLCNCFRPKKDMLLPLRHCRLLASHFSIT
ncbi:hypothetical protein FALCPG4_001038 [Fusarium falciforme]